MITISLVPAPRALVGQEFTNHKKITVGKTRRLRQTTRRPNYRMTFHKVQRKGHMFLYIRINMPYITHCIPRHTVTVVSNLFASDHKATPSSFSSQPHECEVSLQVSKYLVLHFSSRLKEKQV
jgi:hypothetical protein